MIACSQGVAESLVKEGIKKNKVHIIHNTTEIPDDISKISGDVIRKQLRLQDKIVLGISSWFHKERKGFDILFEAFSKLDDRFVLLIIGIPKENQKEVFEYASAFNILSGKVIMPGFVDNIYEFYKAMDIFLLPSRSEGFSLALLEAAASGLPIIASNIPGNDEFICHEQNGLLFNIHEPQELRNFIFRLADDKNLAGKFAVEAKTLFYEKYTLKNYAEKLDSFFNAAYNSSKNIQPSS